MQHLIADQHAVTAAMVVFVLAWILSLCRRIRHLETELRHERDCRDRAVREVVDVKIEKVIGCNDGWQDEAVELRQFMRMVAEQFIHFIQGRKND